VPQGVDALKLTESMTAPLEAPIADTFSAVGETSTFNDSNVA
jgi:hypothetical protein